MTSYKYDEIKSKRYFYVISYRMVLNALLFSAAGNVIFLSVASYLFYNRGAQAYYSTNGISNPEQLRPMSTRNYSSTPLLADDVQSDTEPTMQNIN